MSTLTIRDYQEQRMKRAQRALEVCRRLPSMSSRKGVLQHVAEENIRTLEGVCQERRPSIEKEELQIKKAVAVLANTSNYTQEALLEAIKVVGAMAGQDGTEERLKAACDSISVGYEAVAAVRTMLEARKKAAQEKEEAVNEPAQAAPEPEIAAKPESWEKGTKPESSLAPTPRDSILDLKNRCKSLSAAVIKRLVQDDKLPAKAIIALDRARVRVMKEFGVLLHASSIRALANRMDREYLTDVNTLVRTYEAKTILEEATGTTVSLPEAYFVFKTLKFDMAEVRTFAEFACGTGGINDNVRVLRDGNDRYQGSYPSWKNTLKRYVSEADECGVDIVMESGFAALGRL